MAELWDDPIPRTPSFAERCGRTAANLLLILIVAAVAFAAASFLKTLSADAWLAILKWGGGSLGVILLLVGLHRWSN